MALYNEERMKGLITRWALECCSDFGEEECGCLYDSFKEWVYRSRAMKHFPGRTAFGEALRLAGYAKAIKCGRTVYFGIAIKPAGEV